MTYEMKDKKLRNRVLNIIRKIPYGKVISYKELAHFFQVHPRKIAKIVASNTKLKEIPCYKVVYANGYVGGYRLGIKKKIDPVSYTHLTLPTKA